MTTLPTIHLNGTGAKSLLHEYKAALKAIYAARQALVDATLNMRDFYPQGDAAYIDARAERTEALNNLRKVEEYLTDWAVHCANHVPEES